MWWLVIGKQLSRTSTVILRLVVSDLSLKISALLFRDYLTWSNWEMWWPKVPILVYFKEIGSIHFFPIIFNPDELLYCLQTRTGLPKVSYPSKELPRDAYDKQGDNSHDK
mmetsp:Transcript_26634/g.103589  ORF Transcript_26634/g.103589 Transcript_26634/m.103589 type:complete len:110 (-) Transcript_26634:1251-1580(-)